MLLSPLNKRIHCLLFAPIVTVFSMRQRLTTPPYPRPTVPLSRSDQRYLVCLLWPVPDYTDLSILTTHCTRQRLGPLWRRDWPLRGWPRESGGLKRNNDLNASVTMTSNLDVERTGSDGGSDKCDNCAKNASRKSPSVMYVITRRGGEVSASGV